MRIGRARPSFFSRTTTTKKSKETSLTLSPRGVLLRRAFDVHSHLLGGRDANAADRGREGRGHCCYSFFSEAKREGRERRVIVRERSRAGKKQKGKRLIFSTLPKKKKASNNRLLVFELLSPPRNHERPRSARFPPRRRSRVGEFCNLGCERGRAKARRRAGKRDLSSESPSLCFSLTDLTLAPSLPRNVKTPIELFTLQ